jgi:hypothetical protein
VPFGRAGGGSSWRGSWTSWDGHRRLFARALSKAAARADFDTLTAAYAPTAGGFAGVTEHIVLPSIAARSILIDMRGHHDMGGLPAGPVERSEHEPALWEKRVDALMVLLSKRGLLRVDELRRNIEALPPAAYDELSYYERWVSAIANTLLQRGIITADELGRKMAEIAGEDVP